MKTLLKWKYAAVGMVGLGAMGCVLRKLLYILAEDGKGLVRSGHPLQWLLWLVSGAALALAFWTAKHVDPEETENDVRSRGIGAGGCLAAAIGAGLTVLLSNSVPQGILGLAWKVLGVLCIVSMAAAAKQRWEGKQPYFLLSGVACVFFAVHMVGSYRGWSSNPQIIDYVFTLFANIFLMLFAYQQGAVAVGCGKEWLRNFYGALAVFCCIVCLSGTENPALYLTGGVWVLTNLPVPAPAEECDDGAA